MKIALLDIYLTSPGGMTPDDPRYNFWDPPNSGSITDEGILAYGYIVPPTYDFVGNSATDLTAAPISTAMHNAMLFNSNAKFRDSMQYTYCLNTIFTGIGSSNLTLFSTPEKIELALNRAIPIASVFAVLLANGYSQMQVQQALAVTANNFKNDRENRQIYCGTSLAKQLTVASFETVLQEINNADFATGSWTNSILYTYEKYGLGDPTNVLDPTYQGMFDYINATGVFDGATPPYPEGLATRGDLTYNGLFTPTTLVAELMDVLQYGFY